VVGVRAPLIFSFCFSLWTSVLSVLSFLIFVRQKAKSFNAECTEITEKEREIREDPTTYNLFPDTFRASPRRFSRMANRALRRSPASR
jgi:hypothetical protein